MSKRIAVIGGGISGLAAADALADRFEVTLFEKNGYVGGHTDTHHVSIAGEEYTVDTGFIVFNEAKYPLFTAMLQRLGVEWIASDMSFAVSNLVSGLEYNTTSIRRLFCQWQNLFRPSFYRMINDIRRFYRDAPALLEADSDQTLGDYLRAGKYSDIFIRDHIVPMTSALWSCNAGMAMDYPARYLVAFMKNHDMLQLSGRPVWKTVRGGSRSYIDRLLATERFQTEVNAEVTAVDRDDDGVDVTIARKNHRFDAVVMACHGDQVLGLLNQPDTQESDVFSGIEYQYNQMTLHTDASLMPRNRKAWASWNVMLDERSDSHCTVSYYMNLLQSIPCPRPLIVSLNQEQRINPAHVLVKRDYHHPVYNQQTVDAAGRIEQMQGGHRTYFCGAYQGWGFHEDGMRSGVEAARRLIGDLDHAA